MPILESYRDGLVGDTIEIARIRGAKTAREAAEITLGRALTDSEWEVYGVRWLRMWEEDGPDDQSPRSSSSHLTKQQLSVLEIIGRGHSKMGNECQVFLWHQNRERLGVDGG